MLFRFYGEDVAALTAALSKVKGVKRADADPATGLVKVTYQGDPKKVAVLEAEASRSGVPATMVSHARMSVGLSARKEADPKKLAADLEGLAGARSSTIEDSNLELVADLTALDFEALRGVVAGAGFDVRSVTHEWVLLTPGAGGVPPLQKALLATRGVLVVRAAGGKLGIWTLGHAADASLRKVAEKAGAAISAIERR